MSAQLGQCLVGGWGLLGGGELQGGKVSADGMFSCLKNWDASHCAAISDARRLAIASDGLWPSGGFACTIRSGASNCAATAAAQRAARMAVYDPSTPTTIGFTSVSAAIS